MFNEIFGMKSHRVGMQLQISKLFYERLNFVGISERLHARKNMNEPNVLMLPLKFKTNLNLIYRLNFNLLKSINRSKINH